MREKSLHSEVQTTLPLWCGRGASGPLANEAKLPAKLPRMADFAIAAVEAATRRRSDTNMALPDRPEVVTKAAAAGIEE